MARRKAEAERSEESTGTCSEEEAAVIIIKTRPETTKEDFIHACMEERIVRTTQHGKDFGQAIEISFTTKKANPEDPDDQEVQVFRETYRDFTAEERRIFDEGVRAAREQEPETEEEVMLERPQLIRCEGLENLGDSEGSQSSFSRVKTTRKSDLRAERLSSQDSEDSDPERHMTRPQKINKLEGVERHYSYTILDITERLRGVTEAKEEEQLKKMKREYRDERAHVRAKIHQLRYGEDEPTNAQALSEMRKQDEDLNWYHSERSFSYHSTSTRESCPSRNLWVFEGGPMDRFEQWKIAWKAFRNTRTDMTNQDAALHMMRYLGKRPRRVLGTLGPDEWADEGAILRELGQAFNSIIDAERARMAFQQRRQHPDESVNAFMGALKVLRRTGWPQEDIRTLAGLEAKKTIAERFFQGLLDQTNGRMVQTALRVALPSCTQDYLGRVVIEVQKAVETYEMLSRTTQPTKDSGTTQVSSNTTELPFHVGGGVQWRTGDDFEDEVGGNQVTQKGEQSADTQEGSNRHRWYQLGARLDQDEEEREEARRESHHASRHLQQLSRQLTRMSRDVAILKLGANNTTLRLEEVEGMTDRWSTSLGDPRGKAGSFGHSN